MKGGGTRARERRVVLLVDDSVDNRSMYAEFLTLEGYDVLEAEDGIEAVATARRDSPDLVVMDMMLPRLGGIEATKLLRADPLTREIIIIALSGSGHEMEAQAREAGVDQFVRKPCVPNDLARRLRAVLASRGLPER